MYKNLLFSVMLFWGNIMCFFAENRQDDIPADTVWETIELIDSITNIGEITYEIPHLIERKSFAVNYGYWSLEPPSIKENDCLVELKKRPFRAALEVFTLNIGIWAFDRFALNEDYARINLHTIKENFRTGFVWDNDDFSTNLFFHPYSGNLYFNSARSNGLNFWQSAPYAIGGSLMWEFFMENDPPAINDLIVTSLGGSCLGEVTWRISDLLVDESTGGIERVAREAAVLLVSPMRGVNRILDGNMWKRSSCSSRTIPVPDFKFSSSLNFRYLADESDWKNGSKGAELDLNFVYGNPMDDFDGKPYSFFTADAKFNFLSGQPFLGGVSAKGLLWGTHWRPNPPGGFLFGVFQHFNYQNSNPVKDGSGEIKPYEISEAASFGGGMICSVPIISNRLFFFSELYLNGVLLGGNHTDHYDITATGRDYNIGSGYCFKIFPGISWRDIGSLRLGMDRIQLYTWKGYDQNLPLEKLTEKETYYINAQGDKGNTHLTTITARLTFQLYKNLVLNLHQAYYLRHSHYDYFPDVHYQAVESKIGLLYRFR
jgi:hypothetical protein